MRVCAIAAAVVLAMEPVSLVGVSFQMSFGAVVADKAWGVDARSPGDRHSASQSFSWLASRHHQP
jgi:predicted membrane metal-binding protein